MQRDEAQARADQLNREAPDRSEHRWIISDQGGGDWQVVKVQVSGMRFDAGPLKTTTEQRTQPEVQDDPRPSVFRQIPPYGPG